MPASGIRTCWAATCSSSTENEPSTLTLHWDWTIELTLRSLSQAMVTYAYPPPQLSAATSANTSAFLRTIILFLIAGAAVASREFAVVRFESIIHEVGPRARSAVERFPVLTLPCVRKTV